MNIKNIIGYFILGLAITSCAAVGTKTLYKVSEPQIIQNIGFSRLQEGEILDQIFNRTNAIFQETVPRTFNEYGISNVSYIDEEINYDILDTEKIKRLCSEHQWDAILITRLKFINTTYSVYFIPVAQNYDTEVEMKLVDKDGRLVYNTLHNTYKGNSYMFPPPAERTVQDGTIGAIKRIAKEMKLKR